MNLFELVAFMVCMLCGVIAGTIGFNMGGALIALVSGVAGLLLPVGVMAVTVWCASRLRKLRPPRPTCENGKCHWDEYEVVDCHGDEVIFVCRCGNKYASSGRRFLRVLDDGRKEPYMILVDKHTWKVDNQD